MILREVRGYIELVQVDIASAKRLLPDLPGPAAFHVQQAAEKLARGICMHEGLPDIRSRDIVKIAERLPQKNRFRNSLLEMGKLTRAVALWRYLGTEGDAPDAPDPDAVQAELDQVEAILAGFLNALTSS